MRKPLLIFLLILFSAGLCLSQGDQAQYMKIHGELIKVNDSLCYQVRKGFSRRDTTPWEPFCGKFSNLWYEEGYEYTLQVKEYNPHADTMFVIKTVASYEVPRVFMRVHKERITVNDSLCYQIRKGFSRRDTTAWEPFCGKFSNFLYEEGEEYTLQVKKYDPHADTIFVIKKITRSSVDEEKLQKILKEKRMRLKEEGRNDTIRAIPVKRRKMRK
ncbi:MAG: DUF4377 domain-containing protein [Paludibacteraceae bacterium]|nr:DUF4377 domain-containing protein [Paludibacteraceae bacterium]